MALFHGRMPPQIVATLLVNQGYLVVLMPQSSALKVSVTEDANHATISLSDYALTQALRHQLP